MDHAYRYHYQMLRANALGAIILTLVGALLQFLTTPSWVGGLGILLVFVGIFWIAFTGLNWIVGSAWLAHQVVPVALSDPDSDHVLVELSTDESKEAEW